MKQHNTPEYRQNKRIAGYVKETNKDRLLAEAKENGYSMSKQMDVILDERYDGA